MLIYFGNGMQNTKAWDLLAKKYDEEFGNEGDFSHKYIIYPAVNNIIGDVQGKKIIDLGCGTGTYSRILKDFGADVVGVDFSEKMVEFAKMHNKGIDYYTSSISDLSLFSDESFDLGIMIMVLHSIEDITKSLKEAWRILKSNGKLIIVIPHPAKISQFNSLQKDSTTKYLTPQKGLFVWKQFGDFCESPTDFYLRSISYYFKNIVGSGFEINDIIEPRIVEQAKKDKMHRAKQANWENFYESPSYMIFNCLKKHDK